MGIRFETEWVDTTTLSGPELAATWAFLQIRVNDAVITRVVDRTDTVRSRVYVPLYPLAESLATNWWFLLHEVENPVKANDPAFRSRHALVSARDGYAFPNLQVTSAGRHVHLAWTQGRLEWPRIEFLDEGQAWVDRNEFRDCCTDLVERVVQRLASLGIEGTVLQDEWASIQAVEHEEATFCRTAARLGWDPYALHDVGRAVVVSLEQALNHDWFDEALAVLDGERVGAQVNAISAALRAAKSRSLSLDRVRAIGPPTETGAERLAARPWAAGYALARHVRQELELDGALLPTTSDLARALGEDPQELKAVTRARNFDAGDLVNGVVTSDGAGHPAFAIRRGYDSARRFQFCRGIAEVLVSPNSDAVLTQARSDRQQRSRAFAAEFLAPSAALKTRVTRASLDADGIDELAAEFGVSPMVIAHQVQNHNISPIG